MSSSEDCDAGPKRKRKLRRLEDSPGSTSSGSPIIGNSSSSRLRRQRAVRLDSRDSDSSPILNNRKRKIMRVDTDSDVEDSDDSDIGQHRPINPRRLQSDSDDDSSTSQWESDFSDLEDETQPKNGMQLIKNDSESELSDGQSEKCPICLVSFKNQEIGTPEACDHMFCLDCIQEWSKNVNTCPVDRQEYSLILVRANLNGKVIRQIPIERPVPQNEVDIFEDPTFCEICGSNDHEDRMLLCDGCDLGFHLYCLNPPLNDVPAGSWYCESCSSNSETEYSYDLQYLFQEHEEGMDRTFRPTRSNRSSRIIPRTRQTERVRRRIANNRQQGTQQNRTQENLTENSTVTSTSRRRRRRRKRTTKYRTVYEIDPATGLTVAVQKRAKAKRRRRKPRRNEREISKPKSVKKRLAKQLGMCGLRNVPQNLPDVKVVDRPVTASGSINHIRHSAGIPTLHLFGQSNDLDYFTDEEDYGMGLQILVRRAPNRSDASTMRRTIRRKNLVMPETVSSTSDLLDSILTSQEQLYAKNASYSIDPTGKFKIDSKNKSKIDLNKEQGNAKETPYYNPNRRYGGNNQNYNRSYQNRQQRPYHSNNQSFYHNEPSSSMNYSSYGNDNNDYPQDYSNRTLSGNSEENREEDEEEEERDESELDIYSDIETVTTTKGEEASEYRPLSPPPMPTLPLLGFEDDNNDSEPDMVIDDEKVQEQDYNKEETAVSSTVGSSRDFEPEPVTKESGEIQSEAVQSSSLDNLKTYDYYNDDSLDGCPNNSIYSKEATEPAIEESDDECPNFSIYSKESKTMALHTDLSVPADKNVGEVGSSPDDENNPLPVPNEMYDPEETFNETEEMYDPERDSAATPTLDHTYDPDNCIRTDETLATVGEKTLDQSYDPENAFEDSVDKNIEGRYDPALPFSDDLEESVEEKKDDVGKKKKSSSNLLYSDSEDDESVVKKDKNSFVVSDINNMTEDISEEERSYTPCLDEKSQKQGLEGLDTEMISDEERNDFDESHDLKTVSDGDALEINAKESELDFTRPEDYEEGEIVDKNKDKESINEEVEKEKDVDKPEVKKSKKKEKPSEGNKENEEATKEASFKKLSKSSKDRNYRDKERRPTSRNRSNDRDSKKKKEKRKELERYNVRAIIAEKPRPLIAKDQFGRDIRTTPSRSRSRSRSYTPPIRSSSVRSPSKARSRSRTRRSISRTRRSISRRRSMSKEKQRKRRKSRNYKSQSRSRSPVKKGLKVKKRKRSTSRFRKRKIDDKTKNKRRPRSGRRSRTASPLRRPRDRDRLDWTPRSQPHASPSWTPPRLIDNAQLLRTESLTVTVNNSKKKKEKKKKRNKDPLESRAKKRRHERERTPPPSKEVFASGDNILVSVSFNNENETRDITTRDKRKNDEAAAAAAAKKRKKRKNKKDLTGVKPVAIIDLDRSPFRELTPSPKQIIVLTDSENEDNAVQANICDSSQQVASPERGIGPKTPPEPQVKFSLAPKAPQIRAINNPLIDPDDIETNVTNDIVSRLSPGHKGPSTPLEPPNSPPSSPDAYDPFEPTKSRSPTPDVQVQSNQDGNESIDSRAAIDLLEKSMNPMPENNAKSLTPPLADIQPADSQSSVQVVTPDSNNDKSPTQIQSVQQIVKPVAQTIPFSSVPTTVNTSTPLTITLPPSRINILNATVISPPVASPIPQRIVLPNLIKSVKIPPTKAIKSTPIKPMPAKANKIVTRKRAQNGSGDDNMLLDFDSPYSPGSSDYEDLFDPPSEIVTKPMIKGKNKSPMKHASAFDVLFGSPSYKVGGKKKFGKKSSMKTKSVGVRLDEESLKILDDLPNSAVEMQVKDKFLKKLNRQERVVEEVKLVLKPHYNKKKINKEEYKDIMRRSVPKICHNKSGEINPSKIKNLIEAYVRKVRHSKKVTSSSSVNPLKI